MRDDYPAAIVCGGAHLAERDGTIAVLPSVQGTGLGRLLLDWIEGVARDLGLPRIVV